MIRLVLTDEFVPANLLYYKAASDFLEQLLKTGNRHRQQGELAEAKQCAQKARQTSQEAQAHVERALSSILLSEVHRELGRLGPALQCAQEAFDILQRQTIAVQRHNEAIAAYALGLVHHQLGNDAEALKWYHTAQGALEWARKYWAGREDSERYHACVRLARWLRILSDSLSHEEERDGTSLVIVPTRLVGDADGVFSVVELKIDGYLLGQNLTINSHSFQVHAIPGSRGVQREERLLFDRENYVVFELPEPVLSQTGAEKGDHVLVRRTDRRDLKVPYYIMEEVGGLAFGHFEQDPGDPAQFRFKSLDARVIGADIDEAMPFYYPVALLKPA